ncbi:cell division control protein 6 [Halogranum rubrum]|uniref:ORC1-type DNA replication protein n=2 Tax=Halogranum rubrum TaxID=553466 RepID=A0A1I4DXZ5_9EURY|nr:MULTISPECIES: orc1/cdc6 family replication initiation protein [Halogranum]EJN60904.1 orc1/cdc6 family replication initiation protein [Halogranum salarium B-1]SFK98444.1 cell division control protein 6 [Halogranum rubrum]
MPDDGDDTSGGADPLFRVESPIFTRKELLEIEHIPNEERIVGRDEQIKKVANALNPAIAGGSPRNMIVYGKTGTGKSLVAKHVTQRAKRAAENHGTTVGTAYIDCAQSNTETRAISTLATQLNAVAETDVTIPRTGIATDDYYGRFWEILDSRFDVAIIILDEIDKLGNDEILMQLSRAGEAGKLDSCKIGIIAISNKISYQDKLEQRVKSSLQEREFIFPPYDAEQLRLIMENREDAFKPDVLTTDVIPLSAAFAASEHGDARKALDILRHAGEIAEERDDDHVREEHVRDARSLADVNRFRDLLQGQPTQAKLTVLAVAELTAARRESKIESNDIYDKYCELTTTLDVNQLSQRRVYDLLREQAFLDILGQEFEGRGRARGSVMKFHLLEEPETVRQAIQRDAVFEQMQG